ncbi:MAG TPA: hypothetical protein VHQ02_12085 [Usitatibacter sp.]|jgi:hypothetical protein|nr:hypothetical protein [Usitatibacter sp.]
MEALAREKILVPITSPVQKDLLDPKWKGRLGIEAKDDDRFATVVQELGGDRKGLDFFRELAARNGISVRKGHTLLDNLVVSGEVPLAGQKAMTSIDYVPTNTKVPSPLKGVKIVQTDPIRSLDESSKWSKLFDEIVVRQAGAR